jgi:HSP20 family protein
MTFVRVNNPVTKNFDSLMKDIFNEIPASLDKSFREDVLGFPPVNIVESGNAYHLEVAAPGMEKTDFTIKLDGTLLTISATKKDEAKNETLVSIRKELMLLTLLPNTKMAS